MDPISDMFSKIRNAQAVKKETVLIPYSKIKMEIAKVLLKEKYINEINRRGKKNKKSVELSLLYDKNGKPAIEHISRVSKLSRRVYMPVKKIRPVRQGRGMMIISTPKGLLTNREAKKEAVGGEIICKIW